MDGSLFAVAAHPAAGARGLLWVEEGDAWRRVAMGDGDARLFGTVVACQADRLRVHFGRPEPTVEIPRNAAGEARAKLLFAKGVGPPPGRRFACLTAPLLLGSAPAGAPTGTCT